MLSDDLSRCVVLNIVVAARTLLRRYDAKLKPYGVTVQQFALLGALRAYPCAPVAVLAERIVLDRTSLTRNLDLMERKGLVRRVASAGNLRLCELTGKGEALLEELIPQWQASKADLLHGISERDADTFFKVVRHIARD